MSSLEDVSTYEVCGGGGRDVKLSKEKVVCTSCAQNNLDLESCNDDGASVKVSDSISSADIDAVSDSIEKIGICNDDDHELFQDPPPKEDCQFAFYQCHIAMLHEVPAYLEHHQCISLVVERFYVLDAW